MTLKEAIEAVIARKGADAVLSDGGQRWETADLLDAVDECDAGEYALDEYSNGRIAICALDAQGYMQTPPAYVEPRV